MTARPVIPRAVAERDIEGALAYYLDQGARQAALGLIDALEQAYRHIAANPASGSLRYAHALELPGLRFWPMKHYPYLVFYIERDGHIDVWRVLHGQRDIPAWMSVENWGRSP